MTMSIELTRKPGRPSVFSLDTVSGWIDAQRLRRRTQRDARIAARQLAEHTDAALADIGLTRADLTPSGVDDPLDRQMQAMLRITV